MTNQHENEIIWLHDLYGWTGAQAINHSRLPGAIRSTGQRVKWAEYHPAYLEPELNEEVGRADRPHQQAAEEGREGQAEEDQQVGGQAGEQLHAAQELLVVQAQAGQAREFQHYAFFLSLIYLVQHIGILLNIK